ncbi:MAG: hypothetical protein ACD_46C00367G0002 [uncultured bacterium]|nr:MAG: hypothetical protein ACD_46C00367G0002 [uncultured bacterium]
MKFIIGAYATAPSLGLNNPNIEKEYYLKLIESVPYIRGLEIPFWGHDIHVNGTDFLLRFIEPGWYNVLTCIPGTMMALKSNRFFGLASDDENGRFAALKMHKRAHQKLLEINQHIGRNVFLAVQIATGPSIPVDGVSSSMKSLKKSLTEILSWDWQGSKIVIEHCDSFVRHMPFEKGFMNIHDEIGVLLSFIANHKVGITLNWARSAIEGRSTKTVIEHIEITKKSGLLSGMMFSGTSDKNIEYGVWKDTHMPVAQEGKIWSNSLLTTKQIEKSMLNIDINLIDYVGIKFLLMPLTSKCINTRVHIIRDAILTLKKTIQRCQEASYHE